MRAVRSTIAALVLVLPLAAAAPAGAAPAPSAQLEIAFTLPSGPGSVWSYAAGNCLIPGGGWSKASTPRYAGVTSRPGGLLDVAGRSGEAIVPGQAIHVDRIVTKRPRALAATDVGIQLDGGRAYLTGTIRSVRSRSARQAGRQRLAQLHGVTVTSRTVRRYLQVTVSGRATMLPPLAGMLNRLRCKGPRIDEHPIPVGAPLGRVTATIVPSRASAAVSSLGFALSLDGTAYGPQPPHVEPTGGAQGDGDGLTFAAAAGTHVTATCSTSGCEPRDGSVPLIGGFDFVDGARRLSLSNLALNVDGGRRTISAMLGGTRITVAGELSDNRLLTIGDELKAQLAATFGDPGLGGFVVGVRLALDDLAPA
jgi:hypothetical protein